MVLARNRRRWYVTWTTRWWARKGNVLRRSRFRTRSVPSNLAVRPGSIDGGGHPDGASAERADWSAFTCYASAHWLLGVDCHVIVADWSLPSLFVESCRSLVVRSQVVVCWLARPSPYLQSKPWLHSNFCISWCCPLWLSRLIPVFMTIVRYSSWVGDASSLL